MHFILQLHAIMKKTMNHFYQQTKKAGKHFSKHKQKYLFGTFGTFAIVKTVLLLAWFFGAINLSGIFAKEPVEVNSGNIVSEYGCVVASNRCDLSRQWITHIAPDTFINHSLNELNVASNKLQAFDVYYLNNLTSLDVSNNVLRWFSFSWLDNLHNINLDSNNITVMHISWLAYLQDLSIRSNKIESISFDNLWSLQTLRIKKNNLEYIDISWLSWLHYLDIWDNSLTGIDITNNTSLIYVYLDSNQLQTINLSWFNQLQEIYLNNNQLTEIIGLETLTTITRGDISSNTLPLDYIMSNEQFFVSKGVAYDQVTTGFPSCIWEEVLSACEDLVLAEPDRECDDYYTKDNDWELYQCTYDSKKSICMSANQCKIKNEQQYTYIDYIAHGSVDIVMWEWVLYNTWDRQFFVPEDVDAFMFTDKNILLWYGEGSFFFIIPYEPESHVLSIENDEIVRVQDYNIFVMVYSWVLEYPFISFRFYDNKIYMEALLTGSIWTESSEFWGFSSLASSVCGNDIIEDGEECDDWKNNGKAWYCNSTCDGHTAKPMDPNVCGNGICENVKEICKINDTSCSLVPVESCQTVPWCAISQKITYTCAWEEFNCSSLSVENCSQFSSFWCAAIDMWSWLQCVWYSGKVQCASLDERFCPIAEQVLDGVCSVESSSKDICDGTIDVWRWESDCNTLTSMIGDFGYKITWQPAYIETTETCPIDCTKKIQNYCEGYQVVESCEEIDTSLMHGWSQICRKFYSSSTNSQCKPNLEHLWGCIESHSCELKTPISVRYDLDNSMRRGAVVASLTNYEDFACRILNNDWSPDYIFKQNGVFYFKIQCDNFLSWESLWIVADVGRLNSQRVVSLPNTRDISASDMVFSWNDTNRLSDKYGVDVDSAKKISKDIFYSNIKESYGEDYISKDDQKVNIENINIRIQEDIPFAITLKNRNVSITIPERAQLNILDKEKGREILYTWDFVSPILIEKNDKKTTSLAKIIGKDDIEIKNMSKFWSDQTLPWSLIAKDMLAAENIMSFIIEWKRDDVLPKNIDVYHSVDGVHRELFTGYIDIDKRSKTVKILAPELSYYAIVGEIQQETTPGSWPSVSWWGSSSITQDNCLLPSNLLCANDRGIDYSPSYYDGTCCGAQTIVLSDVMWLNDRFSLLKSETHNRYDDELLQAYIFAYHFGLTNIDSIDTSNLMWKILRSHMAKMISNFAINVLEKTPDTNKACNFSDMGNQSKEMQEYTKLACQLWLMGMETDGVTPMNRFMPNDTVTRAQFGTVLSRLLYGTQYAWGTPYYTAHLKALQDAGVMTKIDTPNATERRWYVMLMFKRVFEK
jgi:hypothetical protein